MDIDISDILASVTRRHHGAAAGGSSETLLADSTSQQVDLQSLTRAWVSERLAPELLPYPSELMERVMRRIRQQVSVDLATSLGRTL